MALRLSDYSSSLSVIGGANDRDIQVASLDNFPDLQPGDTARVSIEHADTHEVIRRVVTGASSAGGVHTLRLTQPLGAIFPTGSLVELRDDAQTLIELAQQEGGIPDPGDLDSLAGVLEDADELPAWDRSEDDAVSKISVGAFNAKTYENIEDAARKDMPRATLPPERLAAGGNADEVLKRTATGTQWAPETGGGGGVGLNTQQVDNRVRSANNAASETERGNVELATATEMSAGDSDTVPTAERVKDYVDARPSGVLPAQVENFAKVGNSAQVPLAKQALPTVELQGAQVQRLSDELPILDDSEATDAGKQKKIAVSELQSVVTETWAQPGTSDQIPTARLPAQALQSGGTGGLNQAAVDARVVSSDNAATDAKRGNVELASPAEITAGSTARVVTAAQLKAVRDIIPSLRTAAQVRDLLYTLSGANRLDAARLQNRPLTQTEVNGLITAATANYQDATEVVTLIHAALATWAGRTATETIPNAKLSTKLREIIDSFEGGGYESAGAVTNPRATPWTIQDIDTAGYQVTREISPRLTNNYVGLRIPLAEKAMVGLFRLIVTDNIAEGYHTAYPGGGWTHVEDDSQYAYYQQQVTDIPLADYIGVQKQTPFRLRPDRIEQAGGGVQILRHGPATGRQIPSTSSNYRTNFVAIPGLDLDDVASGQIGFRVQYAISGESNTALGFDALGDKDYSESDIVFPEEIAALGVYSQSATVIDGVEADVAPVVIGSATQGEIKLFFVRNAANEVSPIWSWEGQAGSNNFTLGIPDFTVDIIQSAGSGTGGATTLPGLTDVPPYPTTGTNWILQYTRSTQTNAWIATPSGGGGSLTAGSVGTTELADASVTSAKIATGAVTSAKIGNLQVGRAKITASAVDTTQLNNDAVTSAKLATDAVTSAKIAGSAVTQAKIAADAVGASQIVAGGVGSTELANNAVTEAKVSAGAISVAKLAQVVSNRLVSTGGATNQVLTKLATGFGWRNAPAGGGGTPGYTVPALYHIGLVAASGGMSYSSGPVPPARAAVNGVNRKYVQPSSGGVVENDWSLVSLTPNATAVEGVTIASNQIRFAQARRCRIVGNVETTLDSSGGASRLYVAFHLVKVGTPNEVMRYSACSNYHKMTSPDETAQPTLTQGPRALDVHIDMEIDANANDAYMLEWRAYLQTGGRAEIISAMSGLVMRFYN